jgi:hypothetical protein
MSSGVMDNCINHDSYGEICVGCNACGRIDKNTMWQARYEMYVRHLKEEVEKYGDSFFHSNLQQMNISSNIIYLGEKIKACVPHLNFGGMDSFEVEGIPNESTKKN